MTLENNLVKIQNNQVVVSSRQVAENFEKRHDHVIEVIRKLVPEITGASLFSMSAYINRGKAYPEYLMNRDGFSLLVMSFTGGKALEWKIKYIQAFNEMEAQLKSQTPQLPSDYLSALKALVSSEESKQIAEAKVAELAPKADVYDAFVDKEHLVGFRDLAKELGVQEKILRNFLQTARVAYRLNSKWKPYQPMIDKGYLTVKDIMNSGNGWTGTKMAFTMAGKEYIRQLLLDNGVI